MSLRLRGLAELERDYRRASRKTARAEASAVRRTGTTIRARQSRKIRERVNLKAAVVKKSIQIVAKPTAANPRVTFEVREKGISLIEYGARQTRRGVTVKVLKTSGRKLVHARGEGGTPFIAAGLGANRQVFARTGAPKRRMKSGRYAGQLREPIAKLWGPSVYSQYTRKEVLKTGDDTWKERLPIELDRAIQHALGALA